MVRGGGAMDIGYQVTGRVKVDNGGGPVVFYHRDPMRAGKKRFVGGPDFRESVLLLGALGTMGWRADASWPGFTSMAARMRLSGVKPKKFKRFHSAVGAILGPIGPDKARPLFEAFRQQQVMWRMFAAREHLTRTGDLAFQINGLEPLREALERGGGAILWANEFTAQTVIGKRGLWEAGLRSVQVTSPQHGIRTSAYGQAMLNPWLIDAENKYLVARLPIEGSNATVIMRKVVQVLNSGGLVIMTNNTYAGSKFAEMTFGQSGFVRMSTTVPGFALRFGTPIFAMTTTEVEAFRTYRIDLEDLTSGVPGVAGESRAAPNAILYQQSMAKITLAARNELLKRVKDTPPQLLSWMSNWNSLFGSGDGGADSALE
jgi:hypothetical protein